MFSPGDKVTVPLGSKVRAQGKVVRVGEETVTVAVAYQVIPFPIADVQAIQRSLRPPPVDTPENRQAPPPSPGMQAEVDRLMAKKDEILAKNQEVLANLPAFDAQVKIPPDPEKNPPDPPGGPPGNPGSP